MKTTNEMKRLHEILSLGHIVNKKTKLAVHIEYKGYNENASITIHRGKKFCFDERDDDLKRILNKMIVLKPIKKKGYDIEYKKKNINTCHVIVSVLKYIVKNAKLDRNELIEKLKETFPDDMDIEV